MPWGSDFKEPRQSPVSVEEEVSLVFLVKSARIPLNDFERREKRSHFDRNPVSSGKMRLLRAYELDHIGTFCLIFCGEWLDLNQWRVECSCYNVCQSAEEVYTTAGGKSKGELRNILIFLFVLDLLSRLFVDS